MNKPEAGRRHFFGRLTKLAAAIGGTIAAGVTPELHAQPRPSTATIPAPNLLPAAPPLAPAAVNALHMEALGNSDVALLLSKLGEPGRIDPPVRSEGRTFDAATGHQMVMMPVASYRTGAILAYVCFGTYTAPTENGSRAVVPVRSIVTAAGGVFLAGGGRVAASPRPEFNEALFATMFPEEYIRNIVAPAQGASSAPGMRPTGGGLWNPDHMRLTKAVNNDPRSGCLAAAEAALKACLAALIQSFLQMIFVSIACLVCILIALGVIGGTLATTVVTLPNTCLRACGLAAGAVGTFVEIAIACRSIYDKSKADCLKLSPTPFL